MKVLFVCLGNICRSPTAEGVLRSMALRCAPDLALDIDSAGTGDYHVGSPPDPRSQRAAGKRGIDIGALRARQVVPEDFHRFDLILAMDRENLRNLARIQPAGSRARLRLFMEYAQDPPNLEVPDPYLGDEADFDAVLDLTDAAARGLLAELRRAHQSGGTGSTTKTGSGPGRPEPL
jgi:protein-tyrosine phosphatase